MAESTTEGINLLGSGLGNPRVVQQVAILAGNAIARGLVQLAEAQAAREVIRARAGCDACGVVPAERQDGALKLATLRDAIEGEIARLSMVAPATNKTTAAAYGVVQKDGVPVGGGTVELLEGDKVVGRAVLDAEGRFSVAADADAALTLRYQAGDEAGWTDPAPLVAPGQPASYRVLDLAYLPAGASDIAAKAGMATAGAASDTTPAAKAVDPAQLEGKKLDAVLAEMKDAGAAVGKVQLAPDQGDTLHVTDAQSHDDGTVGLTVAAAPGDAGEHMVLTTLLAHDPAGTAFGLDDVEKAAKWLEEKGISNLQSARTFADQSLASLGEALGSHEPGLVQTLRNLLTRTIDRIVTRE